MVPNLAVVAAPPPDNGKDPVMAKLEDILARLENVESNTEEVLEKLQDMAANVDFTFGFGGGDN